METKNNPRSLQRFAPVGLYLAGAALLAAAVFFIIERSFSLPVQISLSVIVIGLALFVLLDPQRARRALTGRQARYGSNALVLTIAFVGIIVVLNYLANANDQQWDLTEDKANSLTVETVDTLASLKAPVQAVAYYTPNMNVEQARSLLQVYQNKSNGNFKFEVVDPVTDPIRAQQDKVTRDGTIVLKMEGRQEQVTYSSEQEITGALVRLANPGERAVYFLTGHGENGIQSSSENSYNQVVQALEAKNYTVETLNLLSDPKIPENALAIVIARPTKPISQAEIDLIRAYQNNGGALIVLSEPRITTETGDSPDPLEIYLKEAWGISLANDLIIDPSSSQLVVAVTQRFADHPITQKMYSLAVVMPTARGVFADTDVPQEISLTELAFTSEMAWGETNKQSILDDQVKADQGQDPLGPIPLAVAGENQNTSARVLVYGDADFGSDQAFGQYGNSDFVLNGVDWAAEQEGLISLTPRQPIQRIIVNPTRSMQGLILLGSIFLLPGLVVLTGITMWFQRRRLG